MTVRRVIMRITQQEDLNFLLTNRLPRRWLTHIRGLAEPPRAAAGCAAPASRIWRLFAPLDLSEARSTRFRSLQEFFTRELKDGARQVEPDPALLVESRATASVGAWAR